MRYDYLKQVEYLNSLGLEDKYGQKIQYYDAFYGTDNEDDFEIPFQFYQEYINREQIKYGFTPTLLAFIHNRNINAFAWKSNSLIGINAGTIIQMSELYRGIDYNSLIIDELESFDILNDIGQEGFLEKMYKYCQMFTFLHELGHIIQDDLRGISHFSEMVDCGTYSQEVHIMEYDADQYAAIMISNHINQWMESLEGELKQEFYTNEIAEMLVSTAMSAIFVNYLIFQSYNSGFYTESCSHPHPTIRATYISNTIVDAFKSGNKGGFDIDHKSVIDNAFLLAERVVKDANNRKVIFTKSGEFRRFLEIWEAHEEKIVEYFDSLQALALKTDGLAVEKYNGRIR